MGPTLTKPFIISNYLANSGSGRTLVRYAAKETFYSQGDDSGFVLYLHSGQAKLTVVSNNGKSATVAMIGRGDFAGQEAMGEEDIRRPCTATAISNCVALRIIREEMIRVLHAESEFSDFFLNFMVKRGVRAQADLVDQLFNSAERRLARMLLIMADYGKQGEPLALLPGVTHEMLAEMIGTTRSHVSFFMNRFRALDYVEYNGRSGIRVNKSLLNMLLQDSLPGAGRLQPQLSRSSG
jgi:CRP-like cAMP-binding protein